MKKTLHYLLFALIVWQAHAQTISIVGTGVNGWPPTNGPEITLSTTDNITYTITNLTVTSGFVKFRQDYSWTTNWGGNTFPSGQGVQNGPDIPTVAGTYDVTLNRVNGTYTFVGTAAFPSIGIWGPAVDSQNGYAGADVDMTTNDGITYTLSGFNFSSGNAYFRQDNATNFVWGSTAFPNGTAVQNGPSIPVTGGEYFVTFNRNTGAYSFEYPSIGILGNALNGWEVADTDLSTTNGFTYTLANGLRSAYELFGCEVEFGGSYPGWTPNVNSEILKVLVDIYEKQNGSKPNVVACHAGLECGILGTNYPGMDMISFGPTIHGAHSPDERASIKSSQKFWKFFLEILANIPAKN